MEKPYLTKLGFYGIMDTGMGNHMKTGGKSFVQARPMLGAFLMLTVIPVIVLTQSAGNDIRTRAQQSDPYATKTPAPTAVPTNPPLPTSPYQPTAIPTSRPDPTTTSFRLPLPTAIPPYYNLALTKAPLPSATPVRQRAVSTPVETGSCTPEGDSYYPGQRGCCTGLVPEPNGSGSFTFYTCQKSHTSAGVSGLTPSTPTPIPTATPAPQSFLTELKDVAENVWDIVTGLNQSTPLSAVGSAIRSALTAVTSNSGSSSPQAQGVNQCDDIGGIKKGTISEGACCSNQSKCKNRAPWLWPWPNYACGISPEPVCQGITYVNPAAGNIAPPAYPTVTAPIYVSPTNTQVTLAVKKEPLTYNNQPGTLTEYGWCRQLERNGFLVSDECQMENNVAICAVSREFCISQGVIFAPTVTPWPTTPPLLSVTPPIYNDALHDTPEKACLAKGNFDLAVPITVGLCPRYMYESYQVTYGTCSGLNCANKNINYARCCANSDTAVAHANNTCSNRGGVYQGTYYPLGKLICKPSCDPGKSMNDQAYKLYGLFLADLGLFSNSCYAGVYSGSCCAP